MAAWTYGDYGRMERRRGGSRTAGPREVGAASVGIPGPARMPCQWQAATLGRGVGPRSPLRRVVTCGRSGMRFSSAGVASACQCRCLPASGCGLHRSGSDPSAHGVHLHSSRTWPQCNGDLFYHVRCVGLSCGNPGSVGSAAEALRNKFRIASFNLIRKLTTESG